MPFIRMWVHLIWSTKDRAPILSRELTKEVITHIKGNARKQDIYLDTINAVRDHVHVLISLKSDQTIAKVVQLIKGESSHWVNSEKLAHGKFEWQDEYIALSISDSGVESVREYISNQEEHHRTSSFTDEYQEFMRKYGFAIFSQDTKQP